MGARFRCMLVLCVLPLIGCSDQIEPAGNPALEVDTNVPRDIRGGWAGERTYYNSYFGFDVTIPEGWYLSKNQDFLKEEIDSQIETAKNRFEKAALNAARKNTHHVFFTSLIPPGTPGQTNPNIICMIEDLTRAPGIKSETEYFEILQEMAEAEGSGVAFDEVIRHESLGDVRFAARNAKIDFFGNSIQQKYYLIKDRNYVLMITTTSMSDEGKLALQEVIDSISRIQNAK